ncbi:hypothetical protein EC973_001609 [Apophysomyces ossiformis]|uniref:FYVE-type domain-containing protein n=1 Tax=Apophysomyces ossiformis TaxID=679940 RepID=A0A8H7EV49_9FUNG|nr:hypothetical protein EC973_001609 [Apophysomyces ossiformis]
MTLGSVIEFCTPPIPGESHQYYGFSHNNFIKLPHLTTAPKSNSPTNIKSKQTNLRTAASAGNLAMLKQILLLVSDPLKAVNEAQTSTGLTPLHIAASRGHLDIVQCLIEEYEVAVDSRDKEGETALLKAAYDGRFTVVEYLLSKNANVHQKDKDGWTALHNACSKGSLPIVRLLVERGAQVNVRSKMGHTPLINAASKGYMSIIEYLLNEAHANPLIKNNFGEAAYDVSAAAGEPYICEMLIKAENEWWHTAQSREAYDLHNFHVTVLVILHENQRSTSLLGFSRPHFSEAALAKQDNRAPWSLHPSGTPSSPEGVELPARQKGNPSSGSDWFWLTDWEVDSRDPRVDPTSGWQYAHSFDEVETGWTPVTPTSGYGWVRRRKWVRVMKRRMDLGKDGLRESEHDEEQMRHDYLYRAEIIANSNPVDSSVQSLDTSSNDTHRLESLTKKLRAYEEALQTIIAGIKTDPNQYRKQEASVRMASYSAKVDELNSKIAELAPKVTTPISSMSTQHNRELEQELGFVLPTHEVPSGVDSDTEFDANPWSHDSETAATFEWQTSSQLSSSMNNIDLISHEDLPSTGQASGATPFGEDQPRQYQWESDMDAKECRRCERKFSILVRRHHCRRCGLVVCNRCSGSRAYLSESQILHDPTAPLEDSQLLAHQQHRVCDKCYADLGL